MKFTRSYVKQIIKEELERALEEGALDDEMFDDEAQTKKGTFPTAKVSQLLPAIERLPDGYSKQSFMRALSSLNPDDQVVFKATMGSSPDMSNARVVVDKLVGNRSGGTLFNTDMETVQDISPQYATRLKSYLAAHKATSDRIKKSFEPIKEVNASDAAKAGLALGKAQASGKQKGPGGIKAAEKDARKVKAQSGAEKPNDPKHAAGMRKVVDTRAKLAKSNAEKSKK